MGGVDGPLTLFKKIIELLPEWIFVVRCLPEFTIHKLEIITEVASILIEHPFRLRLTALIIIIQTVVAAVEAAAKIRLAQGAGVLPSYCLGNINCFFAFVA
jgi:hypothetical protein